MTKCQITIARIHGAEDSRLVRIDATDGSRLLSRIEIQLEDFAAAVMGLGKVDARHTTVRTGFRVDGEDQKR
jgi:hypothetical protein